MDYQETSDVAVMTTSHGPVLVPRAVLEMDKAQQLQYHHVQELAVSLREIQQALSDHVVAARAAGVSWASLGFALGVSGEAVRMKYGPLVRGKK